MKKRCSIIIITVLLSFTPLFGQMILTEEDAGLNSRAGSASTDLGVMVPIQNSNLDQFTEEYVPLANGLLLLVGMGGAYLLRKRKTEN